MLIVIPNLVLIFLLLLYFFRRGTGWGGIIAMFVYASLHYGYAIFLVATAKNWAAVIGAIHQNSPIWPNLMGALFLVFCCIFMVKQLYKSFETLRSHLFFILNMGISLSLFFIVMTIGALNLSKDPDFTKFLTIEKEIVSSVVMWGCAIFFAIATRHNNGNWEVYKKDITIFAGILLVLMAISGIYEIATGMAWARTEDAQRASASLFNPNVLGLWCSLMLLLIAFIFHMGWVSKFLAFCFMALLVASLILSGSRSGYVLSVMNLLGISSVLLISKKVKQISVINKLWPLMTFPFLFVVFAICLWLVKSIGNPMAKALFANIQRFIQLPGELLFIILRVLQLRLKEYFPLMEYLPSMKSLPSIAHTMESIKGRIGKIQLPAQFADNSFLSINAIGGYVALALWFWLWSYMIWLGINRFRKLPGIYSSYALVGIIWCFASGLFLRSAQLFPVWIFISIVLGVSLQWWIFNIDAKRV